MRSLPRPTVTTAEAFDACVNDVELGLGLRLLGAKAMILAASQAFDVAARSTTLYQLVPAMSVGPVTRDEMSKLYSYNMVKRRGRPVYDKIMSCALGGVCPLCGHLKASTLDHHLPKASFPSLAVTPLNLIPSCKDCNTAKLARLPSCAEEQSLHPYYDNVEQDRWLYAEVAPFQGSVAVRFEVRAPSHWSPLLAARTRYHFRCLKLGVLYVAQAQQELANMRQRIARILTHHGAAAVREHLAEDADSRREAHQNSWQTATYEALAANQWFCAQGLLLIPQPQQFTGPAP